MRLLQPSILALVVAIPAAVAAADYPTAEAFIAAVAADCVRHGEEVEPCLAAKRMQAVAGLDVMAVMTPRVVEACEAEHADPLAVVWCGSRAVEMMKRSRP